MSHRKYINNPDPIGMIEKVICDTHNVSLHYFGLPNYVDNNYMVEVVIKKNGESKIYYKKFPYSESGYMEAFSDF
ncbi:hypothetical protein [Bacillus tropicus]|uniref:hypothetical protein n=1 Tax=Bacillus tropicus TaxID=2026188 RepID=UPI002DB63F6C|nr:hypothetical protein [Bacillus tropicus]MEC2921302.1 hypothetical protein [Bacillus tropicus]MEC2926670.1 hypothetical protein [Bacillus tropicus]MEC2956101.1 hypothetical protein [Bacillus tropicus]MEC3051303.1 hypothetical protein [Bacillus tropicus]MEC3077433.1 hypothetical protein [Bacillus tropicus]